MSTDYSDDKSGSSGMPAIDLHRSILVLEPVQSHIGLDPVPLVNPSGYVLGYSADCDLVIRAQGIQSRHCEIYFDQGALCVRAWDDKSWLNDMPLLDARLQDGDRLSLGPVEFRVRHATSDELLIDQLKRDQDVKSVFRSRNRNSAADSDGGYDIEFDEQYRTLLRFLGERQCTLSDLLQTIDNLHTAESRIL
ncbi:MAG: FHA domain-containing protein, partial [Planctomycetaceae bacterium]